MAAGAAITSTMLAVLPTPPSEARYATGGNGAYLGAIDWFEWGAAGTAIPAAGLTQTNTRTVAGATLATTCTISSLSGNIRAYRSGSWGGDGMDEMYNIGGTGTSNQLVAGLANSTQGAAPSFHLACSTTLDGAPVPLAGLVMADAEQSGSNEYIQATIPAGAQWRLIDRFRTPGCTADPTVNRTGQTLRITGPAGVCPSGPDGIAFMDGATSADVALKGGGVSAIALGVMLFNDFGDAPASYGAAGALYSPNFTGGVVPQGNSSLFGATLNTPTQPVTRLGPTVDSEANSQNSADATADGTDEDGVSPPASITVTPGETYTLPGVACTGPGAVAGWLDWNGNGAFDPGERSNQPDCTGSSVDLVWDVPADAKSGTTYLRLRIGPTTASVANPTGVTTAGEVEDYRLAIVARADFGDAPGTYGTTTAGGGASHTVPGYDATAQTAPTMLGARVDIEDDAAPNAAADGDDSAGTPDDEDGITGPVEITANEPSSLTVSATNDSDEDVTLAGWVDLDGDGQFQNDERVTVTVPANSGTADYQLDFSAGTTTTNTYARFRIYGEVVADPRPTGTAVGGEAEDYPVTLLTPALDIDKTSNATVDSRPGDTITYTVTATNTGTGDYTAANPARVWDDLSGVMDDATYNNDAAADRAPTAPSYGAGIVTWTGALGAGDTVTITYTVTLEGGGDGTVRNAAFEQCDPAATSCDPVTPACDPPVGGIDPASGKVCAEEEFELPKLSIVKVADRSDLPAVGETVTYTVTVTNEGPGDYTNAAPGTATDDLSNVIDDATMNTGSITADVGTASFTSPDLTWTGALAAGESATIEYTLTYTGAGDQVMINNACVPLEEAQDPQDPCATVRIPGSGLDQDKVASPPTGTAVEVGDEISYTLRFTNTGQAPATVDTFDFMSGMLDDADFVVGSITAEAGLTASYDGPGERIVVTGSVPVGGSLEVTYRVLVKAWAAQGNHILRNALQCQPGDPAPPCAAEITEHPVRALDLEKTSDRTADTVIGDTVTFTVTATNIGEAAYTASDPALVRDTLAGVLDDADFNYDVNIDRPGNLDYNPPVIRWEGGLGVGQTVTITYSVTLTGEGDLQVRNVAWAGPGPDPQCDPPSAEGVDPVTGQPCAENEFGLPRIVDSKSVDPADRTVVSAGDELVYTLTFSNTGVVAGAVQRDDSLAMLLDDAQIISGPATSNPALTATVNGELVQVRGTLQPDQTVTVTYTVRVKPDAQRVADGGDDMLGNFLINPTDPPPTQCLPVADEDSTCNPVPRITDSKSVSPSDRTSVVAGDELTYTLTFSNLGEGAGTVSRDDSLGMLLDDATIVSGPTVAGQGNLTATLAGQRIEVRGTLGVGDIATVAYTVRVKPDAQRVADGGDDMLGNFLINPTDPPPTQCLPVADEDSTCNPTNDALLPELEVTKTAAPASGATVAAGNTITYTHTFDNTTGDAPAPVDWEDVVAGVLDDATLTSAPTASAASLTASAIAGGRFSVTGTVPAGQSVTVSYTVRVNPQPQRGDDVLENFLVPAGDQPPADCVSPSPLCTVHTPSDTPADIADSKTVNPAAGTLVNTGQQLTYTLTFTNQGGLSGPVNRVDDLTHVLDDATITTQPVSSDPALSMTPIAGGRFAITGDLTAGQTVTVTYTVTVKPAATQGDRVLGNFLLNPTDPTPPTGACPAGSEDCTSNPVTPPVVPPVTPPVTPPAGVAEFNLGLDKSIVGRAKATVGDEVRYRLQVTNKSPDAAHTTIKLTDKLPKGLQLRSAGGKGWKCKVRTASDTVRCIRKTGLGPDRKAPPVFVVATATKAALGRVVNTAQVSAAGDTARSNNRDKATLSVVEVPPLPATGFRLPAHI